MTTPEPARVPTTYVLPAEARGHLALPAVGAAAPGLAHLAVAVAAVPLHGAVGARVVIAAEADRKVFDAVHARPVAAPATIPVVGALGAHRPVAVAALVDAHGLAAALAEAAARLAALGAVVAPVVVVLAALAANDEVALAADAYLAEVGAGKDAGGANGGAAFVAHAVASRHAADLALARRAAADDAALGPKARSAERLLAVGAA